MMPASLALRPRTHPPQARIAPVTDLTSRPGSSLEMALIWRAQGIGPCWIASGIIEAGRTLVLSAEIGRGFKLCKSEP